MKLPGFFLVAFVSAISIAPPATARPQISPSSPAQASSTPTVQPQAAPTRITSYTLPPDLYRKARNRGRIGFATRIIAFFYALAVLIFILRSKLAAKFRDWAEKSSRFRIVQAFIFTALLVLTIAILQLPLDIFRECILKRRMFWMRASDKTVGTNASVNGFGASKRIIIWDTTLAQETTDEVLMDFGHEMGHYALGHIWKGLIFVSVLLFVLLYLGYRTIGSLLARYAAVWSIRGLDDWAALPAILLLFTIFNFGAEAIGNTFSRHQEAEADLYSMEVAHGIVADPGQASARGFQKYGETVLDDPTPNPIRVFLFYDHPTTADRVHFFVTYDPWSHNQQPQFVK